MKRTWSYARLLTLCVAGAAHLAAATVVVSSPGDAQLILLTDATGVGLLGVDLRGSATLDIFDPGLVGTVNLLQPNPAPPFGNFVLFAANTLNTEFAQLTFDPTLLVLDGTSALLPGNGVSLGVLSDSALAEFVGPVTLGFTLSGQSQDPLNGSFTYSYALSSVSLPQVGSPVPEPATIAMLGAPLLALLVVVRRRKANESSPV
ncbi:MAG: PEP-CTERM sorting domain-containing protein [Bryobacteraceae bacterium]|nr:PEP-CTERM sorting domain-containing protein [Bryobacteraceae bacterium]